MTIELGICRTELDGTITDVQSFVCKTLRLDKGKLIRSCIYDFVPTEQLECLTSMVTTLVQTGRPYSLVQDFIAADGSQQKVDVSVSLLRSPRGTPRGVISVWQPVDEDRAFTSLRSQPKVGAEVAEYIASMLRELAVLGGADETLRRYLLDGMREAMRIDYDARIHVRAKRIAH